MKGNKYLQKGEKKDRGEQRESIWFTDKEEKKNQHNWKLTSVEHLTASFILS